MAKYGDTAWTLPEPAGIQDQTTPVDLRLIDSSYTAMPPGGWYLPGGSEPIKVPFPHDSANPGAPIPPTVEIINAVGTNLDPAILGFAGIFTAGTIVDLIYDTDLTASNFATFTVTELSSPAAVAMLAAAAMNADGDGAILANGVGNDTYAYINFASGASTVTITLFDVAPAVLVAATSSDDCEPPKAKVKKKAKAKAKKPAKAKEK